MSEQRPESPQNETPENDVTVDPDDVRDAARPIIGGDASTLPADTPQEGSHRPRRRGQRRHRHEGDLRVD
jgi:hypothetical protein